MVVSINKGKGPRYPEYNEFNSHELVEGSRSSGKSKLEETTKSLRKLYHHKHYYKGREYDRLGLDGVKVSELKLKKHKLALQELKKNPYVDSPVLANRDISQLEDCPPRGPESRIEELSSIIPHVIPPEGMPSGSSQQEPPSRFQNFISQLTDVFSANNIPENQYNDAVRFATIIHAADPEFFAEIEPIDILPMIDTISSYMVEISDVINGTINTGLWWINVKMNHSEFTNNFLDIVTEMDKNPDKVIEILERVEAEGFQANTFWRQWLSSDNIMISKVTPYFFNHSMKCIALTAFLEDMSKGTTYTQTEKDNLQSAINHLISKHKVLIETAVNVEQHIEDADVIKLTKIIHHHAKTIRDIPHVVSTLIEHGKGKPETEQKKVLALVDTLLEEMSFNSRELASFLQTNISTLEAHPEVLAFVAGHIDTNINELSDNPEILFQHVNLAVNELAIHDSINYLRHIGEEHTFMNAEAMANSFVQATFKNPEAISHITSNAKRMLSDLRDNKSTVERTFELTCQLVSSFNESVNSEDTFSPGIVALVNNMRNLFDIEPELYDALVNVGEGLVESLEGGHQAEQTKDFCEILTYVLPQLLSNDYDDLNQVLVNVHELSHQYPQEMLAITNTLNQLIQNPKALCVTTKIAKGGLKTIDALGRPDYRPAPFEPHDATLDLDEQLYAVTKEGMKEARENLVDTFMGLAKKGLRVVHALNSLSSAEAIPSSMNRQLDHKQFLPQPNVMELARQPVMPREYREIVHKVVNARKEASAPAPAPKPRSPAPAPAPAPMPRAPAPEHLVKRYQELLVKAEVPHVPLPNQPRPYQGPHSMRPSHFMQPTPMYYQGGPPVDLTPYVAPVLKPVGRCIASLATSMFQGNFVEDTFIRPVVRPLVDWMSRPVVQMVFSKDES